MTEQDYRWWADHYGRQRRQHKSRISDLKALLRIEEQALERVDPIWREYETKAAEARRERKGSNMNSGG